MDLSRFKPFGGEVTSKEILIWRHHQPKLVETLDLGGLIYLMGPHQVGKSTLARRVEQVLAGQDPTYPRDRSFRSIWLDMSRYSGLPPSSEVLVPAMIHDMSKALDLPFFDGGIWSKGQIQSGVQPFQVFEHLLTSLLPGLVTEPLVVFMDEIEVVASLDLVLCETLLITLRRISSSSDAGSPATDVASKPPPAFCLIGSHPPETFVSNPMTTPFNRGSLFRLGDFTPFETNQFIPALTELLEERALAEKALDTVLHWSGGQPRTTQYLLYELLRGDYQRHDGAAIMRSMETIVQELLDPNQHTLLQEYQRCELRCVGNDDPGASRQAKLSLYLRLLTEQRVPFEQGLFHRSLILTGLARITDFEHGKQFLTVRNRLVARWFDQEWVAAMFSQLPESASNSTHHTSNSTGVDIREIIPGVEQDLGELERMDNLVDVNFCHPQALWKRSRSGKILVNGTLYQYSLSNKETDQPYVLKLFLGLGNLAGNMWIQETRLLIQLGSRRHPCIPQVVDANYLEQEQCGYIIFPGIEHTLEDSDPLRWFQRNPDVATRQLIELMAAMELIQEKGIFHHNLWLGSVGVEPAEEPGSYRLRLAGFEMASHIGNLLRPTAKSRSWRKADRVRDMFRRQGPLALVSLPPERLERLFPEQFPDEWRTQLPFGDTSKTDVFSLGMIACHLLTGPLPLNKIEAIFPSGHFDFWAYREYLEGVREHVREFNGHSSIPGGLPSRWRRLLLEMVSWFWRERPTFSEVLTQPPDWPWKHEWDRHFDSKAEKKTYLISYTPHQCTALLRKTGYDVDGRSPEGREVLANHLQKDLAQGSLAWYPEGFVPFADQKPDGQHANCRIVLLGNTMVYFAEYYTPDFNVQQEGVRQWKQAIHFRYFIERDRFQRVEHELRRLPLPRHRIVPHDSEKIKPENLINHPKWSPMVQFAKSQSRPLGESQFFSALARLVELEQARLESRFYAVKSTTDGTRLEWDQERDRNWLASGLRMLYVDNRPPMEVFFESGEENASIELLPNISARNMPNIRPSQEKIFSGFVDETQRDHTLTIRWIERNRPKGNTFYWLVFASDRLSLGLTWRHRQAVVKLHGIPELVDQLRQPRRRARLPATNKICPEKLHKDTHQVYRMLQETHPFFAIQGPPGTGKSTLVATALSEALRQDPSLRVLVSAQSHYALDHLATEIRKELDVNDANSPGLNVFLLRHATDHTQHRVGVQHRDILIDQQIKNIRIEIIAQCDRLLQDSRLGFTPWRKEVQDWKNEVQEDSHGLPLELRRRWTGGANVIFATTNTSSERDLCPTPSSDFDWVIVEEAGKATPTELLQPLLLGNRWLLIGDHKQLPPFSSHEMAQNLKICEDHSNPRLAQIGVQSGWILRVMDMFRYLFEDGETRLGVKRLPVPAERKASHQLNLQFRMRKEIADLISQHFYSDSPLETADSAKAQHHGLTHPPWLRQKSIAWLDTSQLECSEETQPSWTNPLERRLIVSLINQLSSNQGGASAIAARTAILSPYRHQVMKLRNCFKETPFEKCVHTVDSFQGRQADIIILSLVRNNRGGQNDLCRLGFLKDAQRINVLLSRARQLLILVGAARCFRNPDPTDSFWSDLWQDLVILGAIVNVGRETTLLNHDQQGAV